MQDKSLKIARVSTVPFFVLTQLKAQIDALAASGAAVTVIASYDEMSSQLAESTNYIPVNIERKINPVKDFLSLISLVKVFRSKKFNVVHSTTPKAGLLCAIAGFLSGTEVRLHTFTGQPWVTMGGAKKLILKFCDKIIGLLNTHCYADSISQKNFLVSSGVIKAEKISVLGSGSLAGINLDRFDSSRYSVEELTDLRSGLGIPEDSKILLFVGRVTPDKGVRELLSAFGEILRTDKSVFLILVGPFEADAENIVASASEDDLSRNLKVVGYSNEPEKYMALADLLCLPSYREGFGTVVIEAAAMGTPTVGTDIYGLSDAIVNGETGILVPVRDPASLKQAIVSILSDARLLEAMGEAARVRAITEFSANTCSELLINEYKRFFN
ncbi:glycosyltransferase [Pseudomonas sp. GM33]|uniref:glycosyltransferase family 4 protein n=1 Tax=Pseudomonas sp. GM33 TaxID=1144329 RepID=UPI000270129D|nr:glycosyltransferase family 4 protein [Pseudomonas sp. GM33]EJM44042.1 glycosyltransferase [Pseudomonas sp. GM33]MDP9654922.1 glycosyltransferase involved in cell wall biosynthesis [Pseudomonas putida]